MKSEQAHQGIWIASAWMDDILQIRLEIEMGYDFGGVVAFNVGFRPVRRTPQPCPRHADSQAVARTGQPEMTKP